MARGTTQRTRFGRSGAKRPGRAIRVTACSERIATPKVRREAFRRRHFPAASRADWNDWRWQLSNRISTLPELAAILDLTPAEQAWFTNPRSTAEADTDASDSRPGQLPFALTPYFASLLEPGKPRQPLRRAVIPTAREWRRSPGESMDPLAEVRDSPTPHLVHRYPDRVLLMVTDFCAVYCRFCTRARRVGRAPSGPLFNRLAPALGYIARHREVREIVVSGGDPLLLEDRELAGLLRKLRAMPHVEIIRIGTRVPITLPQRITPALARLLGGFPPLIVAIHVNHADELTAEAAAACGRLADAGIMLVGNTVLLKGVNDRVPALRDLMRAQLRNRIRPGNLFHCDERRGTRHFRTSVRKGCDLLRGLRGWISGCAVPHYLVDLTGGGGKVPLLPEYRLGRENDRLLFRNYEGRRFRLHDPERDA